MIHSFSLNSEEEKQFQEIIAGENSKSESAIIRERIFRRRERNFIKMETIDLQFLSTLSNLLNSLNDNYVRGHSITEELNEIMNIVNDKLDRV